MRNRTLAHLSLIACLVAGLSGSALADEAAQSKPDEPTDQAPAPIEHVPGTTRGVVDICHFKKPDDATQLVGKDRHIMVPEPGPKTNWSFDNGVLTASSKRGGDSMLTPKPHRDMLMYVEFNVNDRDDTSVENTGNSGVYIQQRYELQIQNAYGIPEKDFKRTYGGSLYRMKKPDALVSKPAGEWQNYIIVFRAPRWDGDKKTENARITVYHNGVLIHDDYEMKRKTGAGKKESPDDRPTRLQGHNNPVRFRNVWIKDLELD
ncbi:MAG: 3-keto-disaccharide hydrolase [Phycisphaeraceae bacterium]